MPETFYLIDGHAQIFRAYYAIRGDMRSPITGEPTQAVYGVTAMLLKLFSQLHPDYVAMAADMPGKTFRDEIYPAYKATRAPAPAELTAQIPRVFELIRAFGIPVIGQEGLEADDVIASIAARLLADPAHRDLQIRIVSRDKDLEQLLCDRVSLYDVQTDTLVDVAALREKKGIAPDQVTDLLALTGDTADNVPGVEGIGPKTAAQLVQQFGSLEGILANLDQIKGKRRENLDAAREQLALSHALVTLKRDAEFPFSLDEARVAPLNAQAILPLFAQLGFRRFEPDVRRLAGGLDESGMGNLFAVGAADAFEESAPAAEEKLETAESGHYRAITTREELEALAATLRAQPMVSVDTETTGLEADARLCGLSFSWKPGEGVYVPVLSPEPERHLDAETVLAVLGPVLADPDVPKCGHNLKFDARALLHAGAPLRGIVFDSLLASALMDPGRAGFKLDNLALRLLNYRMIPITALIGEGSEQRTIDTVPLEQVTPYAAEDADIALRLYHRLAPRLEEMGLSRLLREVEAPLSAVLAEMENNGIRCDPEELRRQGDALRGRVDELRQEIMEICGCEFAIDSPRQLADVLFGQLGLKPGKRTKTGYSTDIEVLEKLAAEADRDDPRTLAPGLIIEYRQLSKLINTYLDALQQAINPQTGRIHTTFHQMVTATGRLASQNPNLQNIPVRTDLGRQVRKAFSAAPGGMLICADYSQIELRILAHLSEDPGLLDAFAKDQDIHAAVAAQVFAVPPEEVTREMRGQAKTINFGIIYGVTAFGLARRIEGMSREAAAQLIASYKQRFPGIDAFLDRCVQQARECGYVATILGRRRSIPEIQSTNANTRSLGERLALNTVVQGSAADLIKVAMVNLQRRIERERLPLRLLLQIHDELVLETPADAAEEHAAIVRAEMEQAMQLRVPLKAEAGIGADWLAAK